ncbi:MAG: FKBP-type peptidyl-prolyl cis-trans isomerase [Chitinophagaceae bacterium]|nr:FKBP-type peptidyl-prolyl cis-trans isomerase [Chitinophagaceae bacterium]
MKSINRMLFAIACISLLAMAGCNSGSYKKTAGGLPYKLIPGKDTQKIRVGDYVKFTMEIKLNDDSVLRTTGKLPAYAMVQPNPRGYDIEEMWTKLKVGDSAVITQLMDTIMKRNPGPLPPQFKKGDRVVYYLKVLGVLKSDSLVRVEDEKAKKELLAAEIKEVEKYLADKKITAVKTPSGAFVEIINPGTGNPIDSGKYVTVYYTGTTFKGVKFDSNTDTAFHHTEPMPFVVNTGSMMKGFDEGVQMLRKGGEGRIYVPSMLGYGNQPQTPLIQPFDHLVFDIKINEVLDKVPPQPQMMMPEARRQKVDAPQPQK